jgi:hypothetical protein
MPARSSMASPPAMIKGAENRNAAGTNKFVNILFI